MKKITLVYLAAGLLVFGGCKTIQYVPIETTKYVSVHDTTYLHKTDTLVQVPEVSLSDFIDVKDTLTIRSSYATSKSWIDQEHNILAGKLIQGGKLPVQIIEKERVVVKDSLITKEIPIEVDKPVPYVPLFWKIMSTIGILAIAAVAFWLVFKLK